MVDIISGYVTTKNILQDRRYLDFAKTISMLDPDQSPFIVVCQKLAKAKTIDPEFYWFHDQYIPKWDKINKIGGYSNSDTSFVVDNAAYFWEGSNVKVPRTNEVFRVNTITLATNTLAVKRGIGSVAAAAINDNEDLLILASSYPEGAKSRNTRATKKTKDYNYCQIMRTPFKGTRTNEQTELRLGPDRPTLRKKSGVEHEVYMENQFLFGLRYEDTVTADEPERMTGGVYEFLDENIVSVAGGILTEPVWEAWLRDHAFAHGSKKKLVVASPIFVSVLSLWGAGKITKSERDKSLGMIITEYISPHGTVELVTTKTLQGDIYGGDAIALDFEDDCISYRYIQDTILKTNIQDPDADGWKDEYLTECGLQFKQPSRHAILSGVQG